MKNNLIEQTAYYLNFIIKNGSEIVYDMDIEMKYVRFKCVAILISAFILCKYNLIFEE
jgi:hypothetical protein